MEKRRKYVYVTYKDDDEIESVKKVIEVKNLGKNIMSKLHRQISCIQGIVDCINDTVALEGEDIITILEKFYNYKVINKDEMIEPYNYTIVDLIYTWELYAQNLDYTKESDNMIVDGVREEIDKLIKDRF